MSQLRELEMERFTKHMGIRYCRIVSTEGIHTENGDLVIKSLVEAIIKLDQQVRELELENKRMRENATHKEIDRPPVQEVSRPVYEGAGITPEEARKVLGPNPGRWSGE